MPIVDTNRMSAQDRKKATNDLHSRNKNRVGGWQTTPSGMKAGTLQIVSSGGGEKIRIYNRIMATSVLLNEGLDATETDINLTVGGASKFKIGDMIRIDAEHMRVQGQSSTNNIVVKRGADNTYATTHGNNSQVIYKVNPKTPTRYSELSSETLSFTKDGSTFNYPKQMQFIPSSFLTFGSSFDFTNAGFIDYDDSEYDVIFILKDMQIYNSADTGQDQSVQFSAANKSATGFTPIAKIYVGGVLTTTDITSFDDANAVFGETTLSTPNYSTAKTSADAFDDAANSVTDSDAVISLSVTYTITYSAVKGSGDLLVDGYIRAGTSDGSTAFNSSLYQQSFFGDTRESSEGDGSNTYTTSFDFGGDLGDPARVVLTVTDYTQWGATASMSISIDKISYVTASGTTRSVTGANKADAIVIAR